VLRSAPPHLERFPLSGPYRAALMNPFNRQAVEPETYYITTMTSLFYIT
jgi:hypothetical protein